MRNTDEKSNPSYNCIKKEKIPKINVNKEKKMATHSYNLAWRTTWTEEPSSWGHKELNTTQQLNKNNEVKYLYTENCKTLMKDTEEDRNKCRDTLHS